MPVFATLNFSPDAAVVDLRKDCTGIAECGDDLDELNAWISSTRQPDATSPLLVLVGPGTFEGQYTCFHTLWGGTYDGFVTFRGSGRTNSRFSDQAGGFPFTAIYVQGCESLSFESMTLEGSLYGVIWHFGGTSTWTDVEITGSSTAWSEDSSIIFCRPASQPRAVRYLFSSRVTVVADGGEGGVAVGYNAACGETWFFGGEITVRGEAGGGAGRSQASVATAAGGSFRSFGTVLRSTSGPVTGAGFNPTILGGTAGLLGVVAGFDFGIGGLVGGGVFHFHGGNILVDANDAAGSPATALLVIDGGFAHTPGSAFAVTAGSGATAHRLTNSGEKALSPFFWQASPDPPESHPGGAPPRGTTSSSRRTATAAAAPGPQPTRGLT